MSFFHPQNLEQFYGNECQKNKLSHFLNQPKSGSFLVISSSGLGKTTLCSLIFSQCNAFVIRPCYEQFSCHKEFVEFIELSLNMKEITKEKCERPFKILFLDDIDILFSNDRYALSYVSQLVKKIKTLEDYKMKLVITCSVSEEKKMCDLKKKMPHIRLHAPSYHECFSFITFYLSNYLKRDLSDSHVRHIESLIYVMHRNIPKILANKDVIFLEKNLDEEHGMQIYTNLNIFDLCLSILRNPKKGLADLVVPLSTDPTLITMILYDNVSAFFSRYYMLNLKEYLHTFFTIIDAYVYSSIIEANAFINCSWSNIGWTNIVKCGSIRCSQNYLPLKDHVHLEKVNFPIKYTSIPTRSSQHYSTLKKLQKYAATHELSLNNIVFMSESLFEQKKDVKFSDEFGLVNTYIRNICDHSPSAFDKKIKIMKRKEK